METEEVEVTTARAAMIFHNKVINVVVVELDENNEVTIDLPDHIFVIIEDDSAVEFGWTYENGEFVPPPVEDENDGAEEPSEE